MTDTHQSEHERILADIERTRQSIVVDMLDYLTGVATDMAIPAERRRIAKALIVEYSNQADPIDMLAVWEYYCDYMGEMSKLPAEGALARRQYVVDHLTAFCDHWWLYAHTFLGYEDSFDWEFLPAFLGSLPTHDIDDITPEQITAALMDVTDSDSFKRHERKQRLQQESCT